VPQTRERGCDGGHEPGRRIERALLDEDRLDLRDRARTRLVAPGDVQILAADDVGQVGRQDEVGVGVIERQVEVRHLCVSRGDAAVATGVTAASLST
jgi:hypothetical protein